MDERRRNRKEGIDMIHIFKGGRSIGQTLSIQEKRYDRKETRKTKRQQRKDRLIEKLANKKRSKLPLYWNIIKIYWKERDNKNCRQKSNRITREISKVQKLHSEEE